MNPLIKHLKEELNSDDPEIRYRANNVLFFYDEWRSNSEEELNNARKQWNYRFDKLFSD